MINHIKVIGFGLGFTMLYTCCFENRRYEAERHKIFRKEVFHPNVVRHIDQYENLLAFLVKNLDTIIAHKNQSHFVDFQNPDGTITTRQKNDDCYPFFKGNASYDYSTMPEYLHPEFYTLISVFPVGEFCGFEICNQKHAVQDKTKGRIIIFLNRNEPEPTLDDPLTLNIQKTHFLSFNHSRQIPVDTCFDKMCALVKDTLVSQNLLYTIMVSRNVGW